MTSQLLTTETGFYGVDVRLFLGGAAPFLIKLAETADALMAQQGGIKPFSYECVAEGWENYRFIVSETQGPKRTDAARSLVKVKALQRSRPARRTSQGRGRSASAGRRPAS